MFTPEMSTDSSVVYTKAKNSTLLKFKMKLLFFYKKKLYKKVRLKHFSAESSTSILNLCLLFYSVYIS